MKNTSWSLHVCSMTENSQLLHVCSVEQHSAISSHYSNTNDKGAGLSFQYPAGPQ